MGGRLRRIISGPAATEREVGGGGIVRVDIAENQKRNLNPLLSES